MFINGFVIVQNSDYYEYFGKKLESEDGSKTYNGLGRQYGLVEVQDAKINQMIGKAKELYHLSVLCPIFRAYEDAIEVLKHLNSASEQPDFYELIALNSDSLTKTIGGCDFNELHLKSIGYDLESNAAGFIVKEELFAKKIFSQLVDPFVIHENNLNQYGLFDTKEAAFGFVNTYLSIQNNCNVEPMVKDDQELIEIMIPREGGKMKIDQL